MTELSDYLEGETDFSAFSIQSLSDASLAMRKLSSAQKRIDERRELALKEASRISDWVNAANKSDQQTVTFFTESLRNYMMRVRAESGEKSLSLPDGDISSRSVPSKAEVQDKELALKWMLNNGREAWIRTKEDVNLEALKEGVEIQGESVVDTLTGEIIAGLIGVQSQVSVKVSVTGTN